MDKLSTQDIGVRTSTTLIDSMFCCLASRSHSQSIVVIKNVAMKNGAVRIIASKEVIKIRGDVLKGRNGDFALITTHAKLGSIDSGAGKFLIGPMKGMAKRTLNIHVSKGVNLPSRIKGTARNGKM